MPFDFASLTAPFRMQPGLRRLAPGALQLHPNRLDAPHFAAKMAVLGRHADQALLTAEGFDPGPVQAALMMQAAQEHPAAFSWDGGESFEARLLGWSVHVDRLQRHGGPAEIGACLQRLRPQQRLAGLLALALEEDFAALDGASQQIGWLAVCLPSHWSPAEKIGRRLAEVHAPVADHERLIAASAHLARLVTGPDRWERFVWTVTPRAGLDAHPARADADAGCWPPAANLDQIADAAWFRSEHQTFIPVADGRRQAAFTIRVELQALRHAIDTGERARLLHDALASMSPAVLAYRGLGDARDRLLAWLASRAG